MARSFAASQAATTRLDSEYFLRPYIEDAKLVQAQASRFSTLRRHEIAVDGSAFYPAIEEYYDTGSLPFVRVGDVDGFVESEGCLTIPPELCERFPTLDRISAGDIVFTKGGAIDRVGLMFTDAAASRDIIHLNTSNLASHEQGFLFSYFRTDFFKRCLVRSSSQTAQPHLTLGLVRELPILLAGDDFKKAIGSFIAEAYASQAHSRSALVEANTQLLDALGLRGWSPPEPLTYTGSAADVADAGRLDAQYFMPTKFEMLQALARLPGAPLGDSFASIRDMVDPNKGDPETIVRNYDLTDALQPVLDNTTPTSRFEDISSQKKRMKDGDLAVSRLRSYLREIAVVSVTDDVPTVGSSEFLVLRPRSESVGISAEALMIFLKSPPVQTVLKWCQDGSQHPRFAERDLMAIPLPEAVHENSATLTAKVTKALEQRARSYALLEAAKRAVEIAIEDSEAAALAFIAEHETA